MSTGEMIWFVFMASMAAANALSVVWNAHTDGPLWLIVLNTSAVLLCAYNAGVSVGSMS